MKNRFSQVRPLFFGLFLFFSATFLSAQTPVTVSNNGGDQSVSTLGWAVTTLNAAGPGTLFFNTSSSITLTQPLAPVSQTVTILGPGNTVVGENNSQSLFLFQQGLNLQESLNFQNDGALGAGLDVAVTASSWIMGSNTTSGLSASSGANVSTTSGVNVTGGAGGNATVTVGAWTDGLSVALDAGSGGSVTDNGGSNDSGGAGGSASATVTSLTLPGTGYFQLYGGAGGSVTDLGSGTNTGGTGGSASVAFGSVSISNTGNLIVNAGNGGAGVTGGAGGGATVTAGSVSLAQNFSVQAGNGASGVSVSGVGGNGFVSFGAYTGLPTSNFTLTGGNGGNSAAGSGALGGDASISGGSATIGGFSPYSPVFKVIGGNGGNAFSAAGDSGGNGGNAGVSLSNLSIITNSTFQVAGGNGGVGASGATPGAGGQGGNDSFSLGNFSIGTSITLNLSSGSGGAGGTADAGGTGGTGGIGGNLGVTLGTLTLGSASILNLTGGTGGNGGNVVSGGTGGTGGSGGSVTLSIGAVTMASGNYLNINPGSGGNGGTGGTPGTGGTGGQAWVSIGNLQGGGIVNMNGNAVLSVDQGGYAGILAGSEILLKTTTGTLTLLGSNTYSGGTSVLGGSLVVDTGGTLGIGGVFISNGTDINFINSATAANGGAITVANGGILGFAGSSTAGNVQINDSGSLLFSSNTSAGSAMVTVQGGGLVNFSSDSMGGTASFNLVGGSSFFISAATNGVTVGSILGTGNIYIGKNTLGEGTDNSSTTFSGLVSDSGVTGSLVKLGTGTFTLTNSNNYSGETQLDAGTLVAGNTTAFGTSSLILNGGTLAMNGFPFVLTVSNLTQNAGNTIQMRIGGAGGINHDWISVTGDATLGGSLSISSYGSLTMSIGQATDLLTTTGTITGMFQQVQENVGGGVRLLPIYFPSLVELESINPSFAQSGATPNQKAMGADLDNSFLSPQLNSFVAVLGTMSDTDFQTAMGEITPEDLASIYQVAYSGALSRSALVEDRLFQFHQQTVQSGGKASRFEPKDGPWYAAAGLVPVVSDIVPVHQGPGDWSGFISGNGGAINVSSDGNASGYTATRYGLEGAGAELRLSKDMVVGLMGGYSHATVALGTGGQVTDDGGQLGLYALLNQGGFFADAFAEGGLHSYNIQRLSYGGLAASQAQGQVYDGALEVGYQWKQGYMEVGPLASAQFTVVNLGGFSEQGAQANLTFPAQTGQSLLARLGVQGNGRVPVGNFFLTPFIQLAFEHEFIYQGGNVEAGFGSGDQFTVAGPQIGQSGFRVDAGTQFDFSKEFGLTLHYQGELARANLISNQIDGGVKFGF